MESNYAGSKGFLSEYPDHPLFDIPHWPDLGLAMPTQKTMLPSKTILAGPWSVTC